MIDKMPGIAIEMLSAECFYKEKHRNFQVLLELFNDAEPIDLTVTDKLRKNGKLKMRRRGLSC